jgi:hypothetical protein
VQDGNLDLTQSSETNGTRSKRAADPEPKKIAASNEPDYIYVDDAASVGDLHFQDIVDGPDVNFTFNPLDYDNYEYDQVSTSHRFGRNIFFWSK